MVVRAAVSSGEAVLSVDHGHGAPDPTLAWRGPVIAAAAREMGGRFEESSEGEVARAALVLPREQPL